MGKLDKAVDLYLRGHRSSYIKSRTGISTQSLLKQLLAQGVKYTKDDIRQYQIAYICSHFTIDDVVAAYRDIMAQYDDPYKAGHAKRIVALGCGFGDYAKVFKAILGNDIYQSLRNECWSTKQKQTMIHRYGVDNVFRRETFDTFVSQDAVIEGRHKRKATLLERYGVDSPLQNDDIKQRMKATYENTMRDRYGVVSPLQVPEIAQRASKRRQKTMLDRYGAKNSVQIEAIRERIFAARKRNKTLNTSLPEDVMYELLQIQFGSDDVKRNIRVDDRYPYHVDFYILSRDLFIELNGDKAHGGHWFDSSNESDQQRLRAWAQRDKELSNTGSSRYANYIKTWTQRDVAKRAHAKKHRLNYLVFWDGSSYMRNGRREARLSDFHQWLDEGCPDAVTWGKVHPYSVA